MAVHLCDWIKSLITQTETMFHNATTKTKMSIDITMNEKYNYNYNGNENMDMITILLFAFKFGYLFVFDFHEVHLNKLHFSFVILANTITSSTTKCAIQINSKITAVLLHFIENLG